MSLLIVGSCSKIASNLVLGLAKQGSYSRITIADPLPLYSYHARYYKLRKFLQEQRSKTAVAIDRIISQETLSQQVGNHEEVLHITHDYFFSVLSKQALMEWTAHLTVKVNRRLRRNPRCTSSPPSNTTTTVKTTPNRLIWTPNKKS
jgi:hypothetical protein